jgi:putative membrane protein (TIGR04086 family)
MGAVTGLFVLVVASLLLFLVVNLLGFSDLDDTGQFIVLSFALFLAQFVAGYVSGRLASADQPSFHGSLGGLAFFGIFSILSLGRGSAAGALSLALFGLVALVLGYAGGTLGGRPRGNDEPV